ncbi:MAG: peptide MFS transporter [Bacteroidales bacterium]
MLKGHPKGLLVAFFANMGERFGYYTMLAVFILFLQAKYGYDAATAGQIYAIFLAFVYFLPLIGGFVADKFLGYGKTISLGLIVMFAGYLLLAIPTEMNSGIWLVYGALAVISIGTGFFKGNVQALVGNMYDDPKYSGNRDIAFNIFYMGINIGAMFAPTAAEMVSNYVLKAQGFFYNGGIPSLVHKYIGGDASVGEKLTDLMNKQVAFGNDVGVTHNYGSDLTTFGTEYVNSLSTSYHYAYGVACISLIISMVVFWAFKKYYKAADVTEAQKAADVNLKDSIVEMSPKETKDRMVALGLVFFVVIFFWMAFHQNGAGMTFFARDYVVDSVSKGTNIWFDLFGLLPILLAVIGLYYAIKKNSDAKTRVMGVGAAIIFAILAYYRIDTYGASNPFTPQKFQHFNPFFIVVLTPIIIGLFSWLNKKGIEPSAPKKIGIGMIITALGFIILVVGSLSLIGISPKEIGEVKAPEDSLVSPYWLISTFFVLTIAELFLSPMGLSFVSRVSPPKYKGLMQGGWLAATAVGNYAVGLVVLFWAVVPLWAFWGILVVCCLLSATFIFSIVKRLEKVAK